MFCRGLVAETQGKEKFSSGQELAPGGIKNVEPLSSAEKQNRISDTTIPCSLKG